MPQFDFFLPSTEVLNMAKWIDVFPIVKMVIFKLVILVFRDVQEVPRLLSLFEKRIWIYKLKQVNQKSQVFDLFTAKFLQGKTSYK